MRTLEGWVRRHGAVLLVLALGFAVRLALSDEEGFTGDIRCFQVWGKAAVKFGLAQAYVRPLHGEMLPNYPPLSLMIFAATAKFYQLFYSSWLSLESESYRSVIKLPAMLADVITAALVYRWLLRRDVKRAWLGAAIYLVQPAVWYDSAVWGQVDSVYTAFLFAAFVFFVERRYATFGALLAGAALCKAQTVVVLPLAAVLALLAGRAAVIRAAAAGLAVTACVILPFAWGGVLPAVKDAYTGAVGFYASLSSAAYNLWWALYGDKAVTTSDADPTWLLLTSRQIGWAMWGLVEGYALWTVVRQYRRSKAIDEPLVFYAAALSAYAFFVLNAEMHERYLFPFVPLGLPVALAWPRFRLPYAAASLLFYLNLLGPLRFTDLDRRLYDMFPTLTVVIATLQTVTFAIAVQRFAEYARALRHSTAVSPAAMASPESEGEREEADGLSPSAIAH